MEAPEVPIENSQEHIHHHAVHSPDRFNMGVALSTALFAALAALAALLAGAQANKAMVAQIESADRWSQYQAKSLKMNIVESTDSLLKAFDKPVPEKDSGRIAVYKTEMDGIREVATAYHNDSEADLERHETMATAVTLFQVAIAFGAIAVLTKMRLFWGLSLVLGLTGIGYFAVGGSHIAAAVPKGEALEHAHEHAGKGAPPAAGEHPARGEGPAEHAPAVH